MGSRSEYLITKFDRDARPQFELTAPKSADVRLILERLISRELNAEEIVATCLRRNDKRYFDPFQIMDMREDYRREQAKAALQLDPDTTDPIGVYQRARQASIPLGKVLFFAGVDHEFSVWEVEARRDASRIGKGPTP
ncbi:MAG TPA: hypothetical protein VK146_04630 [Tabrizicola sp.]|nr:hypothetical protein [Tabrizicola sp.]